MVMAIEWADLNIQVNCLAPGPAQGAFGTPLGGSGQESVDAGQGSLPSSRGWRYCLPPGHRAIAPGRPTLWTAVFFGEYALLQETRRMPLVGIWRADCLASPR